ncbi:MAG: paraquat-inducible protein A [Marivibrio sp.]|uniref:paraquat-inducible protein A n=1 Tax=Marivibrio sp. TaxID=2039719 RepID=UPI0032ED6EDF
MRASFKVEPDPAAVRRPIGRADRLGVPPLLVGALALWVAGVTTPLLTVTKLFVWTDQIVIAQAIAQLIAEGETPIALVMILFTLVLPLAKLAATGAAYEALRRARSRAANRRLSWIERLGKWSMLDVFIVAVVVVVAKSGWQADASVEPGLWAFAGFAALSSLLAFRVRRLAARAES